MSSRASSIRIGIYGQDNVYGNEKHGCGLWPAGIASCLTASEAEPVMVTEVGDRSWDEVFDGIHGVVLSGFDADGRKLLGDQEPVLTVGHHDRPSKQSRIGNPAHGLLERRQRA